MAQTYILVVEDDAQVRKVMRMFLERVGFVVREAADCVSASSVAAQACPALVIMDVDLPDGSGLDLAANWREHDVGDGVPFLFVSGRLLPERELQIAALGGHFLAKPFSSTELLAVLRGLLPRTE